MRRFSTLIVALALVAGLAIYAWAFDGGYGPGGGGWMMGSGYHMAGGYGPGWGMRARGGDYPATSLDGWAMGPGVCWNSGPTDNPAQATPAPPAQPDNEEDFR